ncbi:PREDICTED: transcription termination factor 1 [Tinamus guttatus]|uniref:transcription termination factor 1 n=1 Tax=Tinamus guttatus TaxID=94827 RepID=UPI00052EF01A|nr:PREDICTED: transcription termination factor 1 [Tinamus guttatus]
MTEKASVDDFQAWDSLKKKKKKHKHIKKHESDERESVQNEEHSCESLLLFEDQTGQNSVVRKKKKKKKKKNEGEEEQPLLDNFCPGLEDGISNETVMDVSPKKKKKRKRKHDDGADVSSEIICVEVNHDNTEDCQESETDYVYIKKPKKKRKEKSPEKDYQEEATEVPVSETCDENDDQRSKKKKKKKKKRKHDITPEEGIDSVANASILSSSGLNAEEEDTVLALPTANSRVTMGQPFREDGDPSASPASIEEPMEVAAEPAEEADHSPSKPQRQIRKIKSSAVVEEDSSDSEIMTPEPTISNREEEQNNSFTENAAPGELDDDDDDDVLDSSMFTALDLDTAKEELEEFIPHVREMSDSSIRKMAGRDLTRFKHFKKQGIAIKFGRFSQKENDQIKKNIKEFLSLTGIENAEKLLFTSRYPEEKETINRLKAEFLFCGKIAEGIPRPWRLIYYRARKIFDPNNYKGRYTKEEKEKLKKYYAIHGNDWKKISEMMSRSNLSVAMKYSEIKSAINYGPWTKEETQKLMHAVEDVIRKRSKLEAEKSSSEKSRRNLSIDREKLYQKLPWTEIETKVGTRYWRQCKQKWNSILTSKMTKGQQLYKGTKGLQAKINLIKRLYEMKVEDANEVNWEELSNAIGDVPRAYVQAKFYKLKVSCVPLWQRKTFPEIIDYLYEEKLPELEEKLQKKKKHLDFDSPSTSQQKKVFQLSEIFDSSEDSDN